MSSANQSDSLRNGYNDSLKFVLENIETMNDTKRIESCIPTSSAEAVIYFSYDYKKEFSPAFRELQKKIVRNSINGHVEILKKHIYMSEFVDGYFAEDYFISIEQIAASKEANFCRVLAACDKEKVKRLEEARSEYCK